MKIGLIIGHDIDSQGAYGNKGISEFTFNDELLSEMSLGDYFPKKHDFAVFYRNADVHGYSNKMVDLHKRIDEWGADISIEFHFNSFKDDSAQGHEVLYCSQGGKNIASILNKCMTNHLDNKNRGTKKIYGSDRGAGFCCRGKSLAIISEPFFGAYQNRFVGEGDQRTLLKEALGEFFEMI